ncbi:MAG: hydroxymethylglutaryl-CoA lyase [Burkholderiaceae bacterium]
MNSEQTIGADRVTGREVGLRDGLQIIPRVMPTADKLAWLRGAHAAGLREIEVGSFVPPARMPQLADTAELVSAALALSGLKVSVLVPNLKGGLAALASGVHGLLIPLSASHAHSMANLRMTPAQAVEEIARIRAERDAAGSRCAIEVGISTAFGCTIQGAVDPAEVVSLAQAALMAGADAVSLADTVGYADPRAVGELFRALERAAPGRVVAAHFHDTRGLGIANVLAAYQSGIRRFDACLGGIGGCPHAPGASGNVATEDIAYCFASMGIATGLDLPALLDLRGCLQGWLVDQPLYGHIARAGLPRTMAASVAR